MLENEPNDTEHNSERSGGDSSPQMSAAPEHPADGAPASGASRRTGGRRQTAARKRETGSAEQPSAGTGQDADGEEGSAAPKRRRSSTRARRATGAPHAEETAEGVSAPAEPSGPPAAPFVNPFPAGGSGSSAPPDAVETAPPPPAGVPAATFQPPQVIFQPPSRAAEAPAPQPAEGSAPAEAETTPAPQEEADEDTAGRRRRRRGGGRSRARGGEAEQEAEDRDGGAAGEPAAEAEPGRQARAEETQPAAADTEEAEGDEDDSAGSRRRRRRRRRGQADADQAGPDEPPNTVVHVRPARSASAEEAHAEVKTVRGSTRLEAKRQRRREGRELGRRRAPIITESEFLARREAVDRVMAVRQRGDRTQIGVLEDGVLVEHYVDKASHQSFVGNVYLGKVQNVLPSMEAAFVDIGKGRNAVLYAGEVNFDASGLEGESKRIESALKSGQSVLVQVTKDPVGHKGARLTSQVSLPGRYLVYVPGASMMGISRKLPDKERTRLKQILKQVMPEGAGVIVRTAAEGASEDELSRDVARLAAQWESIERKAKSANAPELLYSEPDLTIRVVRDIFNEDFSKLIVAGEDSWNLVDEYVSYVAPHLAGRVERWNAEEDLFSRYRIDEQIGKALDRKVWLPSGGSLVIDRTEAMTVVDVNTGKFTGKGGNLEETVTRNNLEAAEEIVRQLRLRDIGGIIVIDFIDMVLESNRDLVLRRLLECLARDRTKHQVAEVTSLGLVQMTRKRVGSGLLEAFSQPCECCNGRGVHVSLELPEIAGDRARGEARTVREGRPSRNGRPERRPEPAVAAAGGDSGRQTDGRPATAPEEEQKPEPAVAGAAVSGAGAGGAGADGTAAGGIVVPGAGVLGAVTAPASGRRRRASRRPGPPDIPADDAGQTLHAQDAAGDGVVDRADGSTGEVGAAGARTGSMSSDGTGAGGADSGSVASDSVPSTGAGAGGAASDGADSGGMASDSVPPDGAGAGSAASGGADSGSAGADERAGTASPGGVSAGDTAGARENVAQEPASGADADPAGGVVPLSPGNGRDGVGEPTTNGPEATGPTATPGGSTEEEGPQQEPWAEPPAAAEG